MLQKVKKTFLTLLDELFPCGAIKKLLEFSDSFVPFVVKKLPKHSIESHSEFSPYIGVGDMNNVDCVSQNGGAMNFKKL